MKHFYSVTEDKRLVKIPEPDQDQGPHLLANLLLLHMSDALVRDCLQSHADYPIRSSFAGAIQ